MILNHVITTIPRCSMYRLFTYIWVFLEGKYRYCKYTIRWASGSGIYIILYHSISCKSNCNIYLCVVFYQWTYNIYKISNFIKFETLQFIIIHYISVSPLAKGIKHLLSRKESVTPVLCDEITPYYDFAVQMFDCRLLFRHLGVWQPVFPLRRQVRKRLVIEASSFRIPHRSLFNAKESTYQRSETGRPCPLGWFP